MKRFVLTFLLLLALPGVCFAAQSALSGDGYRQALSGYDLSAFEKLGDDANSVYESQIESRVKQTLTAAGYKNCSVQASVRIKEQEIYIEKLVVSVPGDMDRQAVAALLKAQLGLQPVVKGLGE